MIYKFVQLSYNIIKKAIIILSLLTLGLLVTTCSSNEHKANKLIRERMSKTLYDYDSYDPIETIVTEAKASIYTDTTCWMAALYYYQISKLHDEHRKKAEEAKEEMEIWGPPTTYSSSYSDNKYKKYKSEYEEEKKAQEASLKLWTDALMMVNKEVSRLDKNSIIGWEVNHRFRCKTRGGYATIGNYRFVMDKDFTKILIEEDLDGDESKELRYVLKDSYIDM